MTIAVQSLYERVTSEFGRGAGSDRLADDFIYAVNDALNELSYKTDLATKLTNIDDLNDTITDMDVEQAYILRKGVRYYLLQTRPPSDPKLAQIKFAQASLDWVDAKDDYWTLKINANQADTTADVIGLGYVGSDT